CSVKRTCGLTVTGVHPVTSDPPVAAVAPILIALNDYADRWLIDRSEATVLLRHQACGAPVHAVVICEAGHWMESVREVVAVPGPGARRRGGESAANAGEAQQTPLT
ncbi:hypothetical protein RA989_20945, partial [Mycobacteroides abscessus subsp. massiliense]